MQELKRKVDAWKGEEAKQWRRQKRAKLDRERERVKK